MAATQFARVPLASPDWFHAAEAPALPPVLAFYDWVRQRGFDVVFLSERPSFAYDHTKEALVRAGFVGFRHLLVREPVSDVARATRIPLRAAEWKYEARCALERQGYRVVATVGDQASDFEGGTTGFAVKLPNYLYLED
jgi:predicted secreted acid phosphatase